MVRTLARSIATALLALAALDAIPVTSAWAQAAGPRAALSDLASSGPHVAIPAFPKAAVTDTLSTLSADQITKNAEQLARFEKLTGHRVLVWIGKAPAGEQIESWTGRTWTAWKARAGAHPLAGILFVFPDRKTAQIEADEHVISKYDARSVVNGDILDAVANGYVEMAVTYGLEDLLHRMNSRYPLAAEFENRPMNYGSYKAQEAADSALEWFIVFLMFAVPVAIIAGLIRRLAGRHNTYQSSSKLKPPKAKSAK
jgi:uncharacterized membrane protein YgcG